MVLKQNENMAEKLDMFENDVKMYGTQTSQHQRTFPLPFENDVKMYGTQTVTMITRERKPFENDVKMYGTQTYCRLHHSCRGLRMM